MTPLEILGALALFYAALWTVIMTFLRWLDVI